MSIFSWGHRVQPKVEIEPQEPVKEFNARTVTFEPERINGEVVVLHSPTTLSYSDFLTKELPHYLNQELDLANARLKEAEGDRSVVPDERLRKSKLEDRLDDLAQLNAALGALAIARNITYFDAPNSADLSRSAVENMDVVIGRLADFMQKDGEKEQNEAKKDVAKHMREEMRKHYLTMISGMTELSKPEAIAATADGVAAMSA